MKRGVQASKVLRYEVNYKLGPVRRCRDEDGDET